MLKEPRGTAAVAEKSWSKSKRPKSERAVFIGNSFLKIKGKRRLRALIIRSSTQGQGKTHLDLPLFAYE
jgi:hypothetical protein